MPKGALLQTPPQWQSYRNYLKQRLPENVQSWVLESNSLTQRLRRHYGRRFEVRILYHQWHKPCRAESQLLGLSPDRFALIREVLLQADHVPLILARSIIPASTIAVAQRNLSHLGTRPLGEVIFSYPNLQRQRLEITLVPPCCWQKNCQQRFNILHPLWGRRTVYAIPEHTLLVSEFFLPNVLDLT